MIRCFRDFEIQEKIGAGGMSTVYRGIHTTLGYPVAVKVLHPGLAGDAHFIARFEREAKAASGLRSVNIASVIDFGSENDIYFIVMEFIDGPDLAHVFDTLRDESGAQQPFPAEIALLLLEDVAYGLREAHAQGIIHRDIKPSNVLINSRGEVKLVDFGLARSTRERALLTASPADDLTRPGMIIGTPSYMSPEQAAGKEDIDHRTDIFALGVMAYQIIAGEKPFLGDSPSEVQERILNQTPRPLAETRCPLFTPEMESMLERMLAKDPGKRFQSMDHVLGALRECMEGIDVTGDLAKLRRDYLARFAQDPGANARELRHNAVDSHLRLGFHFKNLGLTSIDDAQLEFSRVLRLDPKNQKAARALAELRQQAGQAHTGAGAAPAREELPPAKGALVPNQDATAVLPAGGAPEPKDWSAAAPMIRDREEPGMARDCFYFRVMSEFAGLVEFEVQCDPNEELIAVWARIADEKGIRITAPEADGFDTGIQWHFAWQCKDVESIRALNPRESLRAGGVPPNAVVHVRGTTCAGGEVGQRAALQEARRHQGAWDLAAEEELDVQFTVFRPLCVAPARWNPMLVFMHFSDDVISGLSEGQRHKAGRFVEAVRRRAREFLGEQINSYGELRTDARQPVPREGEITFVPEVEGVEIYPPLRSFLWLGKVHSEEFQLRASTTFDRKICRGQVSVFLGTVLLAEIAVNIRVDSARAGVELAAPVASESAARFRRIFASYSHRDWPIVRDCRHVAGALGDEYLLDVTHLRAGEVWSERLATLIEEADVFQLFWSWNSIDSTFVEREWRHAVSLNRPGFVRPVFWEQPLPRRPERDLPPVELKSLHFRYMPLGGFGLPSTIRAILAGYTDTVGGMQSEPVDEAPEAHRPAHHEPETTGLSPRWPRRGRALALASAVVIVMLMVGSALFLGTVSRPSPGRGQHQVAVDSPRIPSTGSLKISSTPPAAAVAVRRPWEKEFRDSGLRTPCEIRDLAAGPWEMQLALYGCEPLVVSVPQVTDGTRAIEATLRELLPAAGPAPRQTMVLDSVRALSGQDSLAAPRLP